MFAAVAVLELQLLLPTDLASLPMDLDCSLALYTHLFLQALCCLLHSCLAAPVLVSVLPKPISGIFQPAARSGRGSMPHSAFQWHGGAQIPVEQTSCSKHSAKPAFVRGGWLPSGQKARGNRTLQKHVSAPKYFSFI